MRIIGGTWRRRQIAFPQRADLRPTPDRVRETLFNWLGQDLTGSSALDLYSGSGALAFEALSRNALPVVAVDRDVAVVNALRENARLLGASLEIHQADAATYLAQETRRFDIVFLDPPYRDGIPARLWELLAARLNPGARVYFEADRPLTPPSRWKLLKAHRAGQVHYHLAAYPGDANTTS